MTHNSIKTTLKYANFCDLMLGKNITQDIQLTHYYIGEHMEMLVGKINHQIILSFGFGKLATFAIFINFL